jgi:hypothetical protein
MARIILRWFRETLELSVLTTRQDGTNVRLAAPTVSPLWLVLSRLKLGGDHNDDDAGRLFPKLGAVGKEVVNTGVLGVCSDWKGIESLAALLQASMSCSNSLLNCLSSSSSSELSCSGSAIMSTSGYGVWM